MNIDLSKYISSDGNVFALSGLPEEVIAVLLAKYSRSHGGLRDILRKMLEGDELAAGEGGDGAKLDMANEKARAFHEKYVVGYGHGSVGEHAVIHMGVEGVSILAAKAIEDCRIGGSWTEKSTRYVSFDTQGFTTPPELNQVGLEAECGRYEITCARLIDSYQNLVRKIIQTLRQRHPRPDDMKVGAYDTMVDARAFDLCRGLLPASANTNLGMTINARAMELLLTKLYSHPAGEMRELAVPLHRESKKIAPTLVKYAAPSTWRKQLRKSMSANTSNAQNDYAKYGQDDYLRSVKAQRRVRIHPTLVQRAAQQHVIECILWETDGVATATFVRLDEEYNDDTIIAKALANRTRHERAPRAFESIGLQMELVLDYGCFRDLQRHRMVSWIGGPLTAELGFDIPEGLLELGAEHVEAYTTAMQTAEPVWRELREKVGVWAAQYVVPLGYNYHVLANTNLRELFHLVELRSGKGGHVGYRRIAQELHHQAAMHWPWAAKHMRCDHATYDFARE
jgi:thymidylate synthase ThyX